MTTPFITHWLTQTDYGMKQLITIVCILLTLSVSAQDRRPNRSGQFSPAEYAKHQREFFTQNAGLTQEEADAFFPIYNELQQKKREINREIRMAMRQEGGAEMSEEQSLKTIDARANANIRIAELEKEEAKVKADGEHTGLRASLVSWAKARSSRKRRGQTPAPTLNAS